MEERGADLHGEAVKRLQIWRLSESVEGTFSLGAFADGGKAYHFVELPWHNNDQNVSRIPGGLYIAHIAASPHFNRDVYVIQNVPGRENIELHPGNWGGDPSEGYHSDLRGCCSPGMERGMLVTPRGVSQSAVLYSSHALDLIIEHAAGESIEIQFIDMKGGGIA